MFQWMQQMGAYLRRFGLLAATACVLAACGANAAKSDLQAIAEVFKQTGFSPSLEQEYQERMKNAKSEEDLKVIVQDMAGVIGQAGPKLQALSLKTEEGKSIRDQLAKGMTQVAAGMQKSLTIDPRDVQAQVALSQELQQGQKAVMQGFAEFSALAKKEGIDIKLDH